ncbi:hypothetical protein OSH11_11800 [Kaistia dalseonensis]|uniref:Uncharacterized protein n=1 Tax=Kaistia dalseonensis TaxID=410840 RepID=A0ABU0H883_9HYPH|nr:hypothetical protein [Kaistia dalseonensis]MCX5495392.1 hypothetical protein [Kaistia dalseonensis]MDQ0437980.1 hypothetical protein [Kaistia dalseonensis]
MADDTFTLPDASFAEVAVDLFLIARDLAGIVSQLEVFAARWPSTAATITLTDTKASAERAGQMYRFVKAMIPHEAAIRSAVQALQPVAAPREERAA